MKPMKNSLTMLILLASISPLAEAANYCALPNSILSHVEDCTDNEYVSEAAVLCLTKLQNEIKVAQAAVQTTTAANSAQARNSQSSLENNAHKDYKFSKVTLDMLIKNAGAAQNEVIAYESILAMPEDFDEPDITGMSTEEYLKSTPCHFENKQVIRDVAEDIDFILSDLEFARDSGENLESATGGHENNLGTQGLGPIMDNTSKKEAPKAQKKLNTNSSGISDSSLPKK